jgi:hypothetical protein
MELFDPHLGISKVGVMIIIKAPAGITNYSFSGVLLNLMVK